MAARLRGLNEVVIGPVLFGPAMAVVLGLGIWMVEK
jgi:hypothetical protein